MVKPKYDIPIIVKVGAGDRDWLIGVLREDRKGACGVESQASNCTRIDVMLVQNSLDGGANTSPDVVGRLFLQ